MSRDPQKRGEGARRGGLGGVVGSGVLGSGYLDADDNPPNPPCLDRGGGGDGALFFS